MMNNTEAAMTIAATLNDGAIRSNHDSHAFYGEDGRCLGCDCRPFGRWADSPCDAPYWR